MNIVHHAPAKVHQPYPAPHPSLALDWDPPFHGGAPNLLEASDEDRELAASWGLPLDGADECPPEEWGDWADDWRWTTA